MFVTSVTKGADCELQSINVRPTLGPSSEGQAALPIMLAQHALVTNNEFEDSVCNQAVLSAVEVLEEIKLVCPRCRRILEQSDAPELDPLLRLLAHPLENRDVLLACLVHALAEYGMSSRVELR